MDLQFVVVLIVVGWALLWMSRRAYRWWKGTGDSGACGRGGCGSCPSSTGENASSLKLKPFVSLDQLRATGEQQPKNSP